MLKFPFRFLFKTYIILAIVFLLISVISLITGPWQIAAISGLGLGWSLVGILINSAYFSYEEKHE
jgi:hypothetical protein